MKSEKEIDEAFRKYWRESMATQKTGPKAYVAAKNRFIKAMKGKTNGSNDNK